MAIEQGSIITAEEFNDLALVVDRVYNDITPSAAFTVIEQNYRPLNPSQTNVIFFLSGMDPYYTDITPGKGPFLLSPKPNAGDFLVVQIGNQATKFGYFMNIVNGTITFLEDLPAGTQVMVFNRTTHIYGWGNAPTDKKSVTEQVDADDINQLIDRTNIILRRTGFSSVYDNVLPRTDILAEYDQELRDTLIGTIINGDKTYINAVAELTTGPMLNRVGAWSDSLAGAIEFEFTNYQRARYFFNAGGEIRFDVDISGNVNLEGIQEWVDIATALGTVKINWDRATQTGSAGVSNLEGFFHLTPEYQVLFLSDAVESPYSSGDPGDFYGGYVSTSRRIEISAKLQETNSSFKVVVQCKFYEPNATLSLPMDVSVNSFVFQPSDVDLGGSTAFTMNAPTVNILQQLTPQ